MFQNDRLFCRTKNECSSKSMILCWYVACVKECFFFPPQICSYFGYFVDFFEQPFSAYCCVWNSFITFRNNPSLLVCEIWKHKVFHWKKIINEYFFFRKIDLHQHSKKSKKRTFIDKFFFCPNFFTIEIIVAQFSSR